MILENAADFKFVDVSATVDEDHPHGDLDLIDLSLDVRPNRGSEDRDVLAGKDVAALTEALGERYNFNNFIVRYPSTSEPAQTPIDSDGFTFTRVISRMVLRYKLESLQSRTGLASEMADPEAALSSEHFVSSSSVFDSKKLFSNHFGQKNSNPSSDYIAKAGFVPITIAAGDKLDGSVLETCFENVRLVTRFAYYTMITPSTVGATGTMENVSGGVGRGTVPLSYVFPRYCYHDHFGCRSYVSEGVYEWGWHKSVHTASTGNRYYVACPASCEVHLFWTGCVARYERIVDHYTRVVTDDRHDLRVYVGSKTHSGNSPGCVSFSDDEIRAAVFDYVQDNFTHGLDVSDPQGDGKSEAASSTSIIETINMSLGVVIDLGAHTKWWD